MGDREKMKVGTGYEAEFQQIVVQESAPGLPVEAVRAIHQDDRHDRCLAGLEQGQHLESLVERPEAAGKKHEGAGLLHEAQLAGKEVIEVDELGVARDHGIGALLEGEPDVQPEALLRAGSLLGGAHDAVAPAGDDHELLLHDPAREFPGQLKIRLLRTGSRRSEDGHLAHLGVFPEDGGRVTHLAHRAADQLEIGEGGVVLPVADDRLHHVPEEVGAPARGQASHQLLDDLFFGTRCRHRGRHFLASRAKSQTPRPVKRRFGSQIMMIGKAPGMVEFLLSASATRMKKK